MVAGHVLHRLAAEQPLAFQFALGQQHLGKAVVVVDGADHAPAAGEERGPLQIARPLRIVLQLVGGGRDVLIAGGEAILAAGANVEAGIRHAERLRDAFGDELVERLAGEAFHQIAADVRGHAVVPERAGRELERQVGETLHHLLQGAAVHVRAPVQGIHRMLVHEAVGEAGCVGEQMLDGHRRIRLAGGVALGVAAVEDFEIGPAVDGLGHRIVQLKAPFLVEHHQRHAGDGLGHRVEAHHRIALHRRSALHVAQPAGVEEGFLAAAGHQAQCARQLAGFHVAVDVRGDAAQPVRMEAVAHGIPSCGAARLAAQQVDAAAARACDQRRPATVQAPLHPSPRLAVVRVVLGDERKLIVHSNAATAGASLNV